MKIKGKRGQIKIEDPLYLNSVSVQHSAAQTIKLYREKFDDTRNIQNFQPFFTQVFRHSIFQF